MIQKVKKIHFIGIGGAGMNGIAEIFINMGYEVTGSDIKRSENTDRIKRLGGKIFIGHRAENVTQVDAVVYSNAVPDTNPEILKAKELKIPVMPRALMLNEVMRLKYGVAVAGTHGKTSTTSMIAHILEEAKMDPTYVIGGVVKAKSTHAKAGKGRYVIVEACEAFGSFLHLSPVIAGVTNIDDDHMDYYKNMDSLKEAFVNFVNKVPFYGAAYLNGDDRNVRAIESKIFVRKVFFGMDPKNDIFAGMIKTKGFRQTFKVTYRKADLGDFELNVAGKHSVMNSLMAIAIAHDMGIKPEIIKKALKKFKNVKRRFSIFKQKNYTIVEDYAHHPTEVRTVLATARTVTDKNIIAVFQPHLFSRTQQLYKDFAKALEMADHVIIDNIYPSREAPVPGVTSDLIKDSMTADGYKNVSYEKNWKDIVKQLKKTVKKGDFVFLIGAGNIIALRDEIKKGLKIK
ncbi:MAG: UDP-N-acetylmuramate--L-alanine ligase [bacterium]